MSWAAVAGAAVTAGGAYLSSQKNKPGAIAPPAVADPRAPGGVTTATGGGFYVDPSTGRTVFASGQGGGGGRTLDSYRDRMLMDMLMGGGDSVGMDLDNQIKEAQARLDRYKSGSGAIKGLNIADYTGKEWVDDQGGFKDPSKLDYGQEMAGNSALFQRFLSDTHNGDYGKGSLQDKFSRWTNDAYKNNIQKAKEKYDNDLKTQGGNTQLNTEEQAAAQRQLEELMGIKGQLGGMRDSLSSNPLLQMMSAQTGRRSRNGNTGIVPPGPFQQGGDETSGGGGGPMPIPGRDGNFTSQGSGLNYDQSFDDPRKAGMNKLSVDYLAKAGKDNPFMASVSSTWANPTDADLGPEGASLLEQLSAHKGPGMLAGGKLAAPGLDTAGLGSFQQYLRNQASGQFDQQDQLDRERAAAAGAGFGSESAIAGLARRRQLTDALTGVDAQVFGLGQTMKDKNWDQQLGAATHNLNVDKANQDYSLDFDKQGASAALALGSLRDSAFQRGLNATKLNADLQGLDWGRGMDAFNATTGLDQRDIDNNFRNETLGMAQDEASTNNRLRIMDWLRGGDQMRFNQDLATQGANLGEMQFGSQVGGNYLQQMLEAELARAGMQSSANAANQQVQSGQNAALMQLLASLGASTTSAISGYQAAKIKAGQT